MFQPMLSWVICSAYLCSTFYGWPPLNLASLQTQEPELLSQGRQALVKGEFEKAVAKLKQAAESEPNKDDRARANYYLGRAYYFLKRYDEALKTYRQLVDADPRHIMPLYEIGKIFIEQKDFAQAAQQYARLKSINQTLQNYAKKTAETLAKNSSETPAIEAGSILLAATGNTTQQFADELAIYLADLFPPEEAARYQVPLAPIIPNTQSNLAQLSVSRDQVQTELPEMGRNGVGRVTFLYREKARYTEAARFNMVQGSVVLSVIFSAEGETKNIRVLHSLPEGLTRKAIEAASKIRFQPATKDGMPVSVRAILEYSFNLY
jgi:TonB family protein